MQALMLRRGAGELWEITASMQSFASPDTAQWAAVGHPPAVLPAGGPLLAAHMLTLSSRLVSWVQKPWLHPHCDRQRAAFS